MTITPFICNLSAMSEQIGKSVQQMAQFSDLNSWTQAAAELGRIEAIAENLKTAARMTRDILWEENEAHEGRR